MLRKIALPALIPNYYKKYQLFFWQKEFLFSVFFIFTAVQVIGTWIEETLIFDSDKKLVFFNFDVLAFPASLTPTCLTVRLQRLVCVDISDLTKV